MDGWLEGWIAGESVFGVRGEVGRIGESRLGQVRRFVYALEGYNRATRRKFFISHYHTEGVTTPNSNGSRAEDYRSLPSWADGKGFVHRHSIFSWVKGLMRIMDFLFGGSLPIWLNFALYFLLDSFVGEQNSMQKRSDKFVQKIFHDIYGMPMIQGSVHGWESKECLQFCEIVWSFSGTSFIFDAYVECKFFVKDIKNVDTGLLVILLRICDDGLYLPQVQLLPHLKQNGGLPDGLAWQWPWIPMVLRSGPHTARVMAEAISVSFCEGILQEDLFVSVEWANAKSEKSNKSVFNCECKCEQLNLVGEKFQNWSFDLL